MNTSTINSNNVTESKFEHKSKATRKWPLVTQTAKLEIDEAHTSEATASSDIISRIRKCLERGNHEKTPRVEAEAAVQFARRLMSRFNVSQSDVYSKSSNQEEELGQAGRAVVRIQRAKPGDCKRITQYNWVLGIANTMELFFECKYYTEASSDHKRYSFIFYGIEVSAMAAALAFELVHKLACEWARPKGGTKSKMSYLIGVSDGLRTLAKRERNREEKEAAEKEEKRLEDTMKMEEKQRQEALKRLDHPLEQDPAAADPSAPPGADIANIRGTFHQSDTSAPVTSANGYDSASNYRGSDGSDGGSEGYCDSDTDADTDLKSASSSDSDSDNESDMAPTFEESDGGDIDLDEDFEKQIQEQMERRRYDTIKQEDGTEYIDLTTCSDDDSKSTCIGKAVKPSHENENSRSATEKGGGWGNPWQLIKFRDNAARIADEWRKSQDIKLYARRKSRLIVHDWKAHKIGVNDSKKIDLKRKRVEGGNMQLLESSEAD